MAKKIVGSKKSKPKAQKIKPKTPVFTKQAAPAAPQASPSSIPPPAAPPNLLGVKRPFWMRGWFVVLVVVIVAAVLIYVFATKSVDSQAYVSVEPDVPVFETPDMVVDEPVVEEDDFEVLSDGRLRVLDRKCEEIADSDDSLVRQSNIYAACMQYCEDAGFRSFSGQRYCNAADELFCICV